MKHKEAKEKFKNVIRKLKVLQIWENAIADGVLSEISGREVFTDPELEIQDKFYSGEIFEAILNEQSQLEDTTSPLKMNAKFIPHLEDLNALARKYDYILVTKVL